MCALISRRTGGTNNIINDGCVPAITALQPLAGPDWLHSTHFDLSQQELNNTGHVRPLPSFTKTPFYLKAQFTILVCNDATLMPVW